MSFENCFYEISMVFNNIINAYFVHYYEQLAVRLDSVLLYCYGMPPFRNVVMSEETETGQKCERSVELLQGRNYLDAMFLDGRFRDIGPCFEKKTMDYSSWVLLYTSLLSVRWDSLQNMPQSY